MMTTMMSLHGSLSICSPHFNPPPLTTMMMSLVGSLSIHSWHPWQRRAYMACRSFDPPLAPPLTTMMMSLVGSSSVCSWHPWQWRAYMACCLFDPPTGTSTHNNDDEPCRLIVRAFSARITTSLHGSSFIHSPHLTGGNHFYDKSQAFTCSMLCIMPSGLMRYHLVITLSDFFINHFPWIFHCDFHNSPWDISLWFS